MRTGAIFARGSCRALKWMALFGVVFALGAGQAVAQAKPSKPILTTVEGVSGADVKLTWTYAGPAVTGFVTQNDVATAAAFTDTVPTPATVTGGFAIRTITLTSVATAGEERRYRVGAVNAAGTTWSDPRTFTTVAPPTGPAGFAVIAGDNKATLTWEAGTGGGAVDYYQYNSKPGNASSAFGTTGWKRVPRWRERPPHGNP